MIIKLIRRMFAAQVMSALTVAMCNVIDDIVTALSCGGFCGR